MVFCWFASRLMRDSRRGRGEEGCQHAKVVGDCKQNGQLGSSAQTPDHIPYTPSARLFTIPPFVFAHALPCPSPPLSFSFSLPCVVFVVL